MIESDSPLPHSVYWRRRVIAAGASVLAVVLLAWIIGGLVEADDQHPVRGTAGGSNLAATATPPRSSLPPSARPAGSPGSTATQRATSAAQTPRPGQPSVTPPPTTTPPPTKPPTKVAAPGPPQPCPDAVVKVTARPDQPSYRVGQRPLLSLELINVGKAPCTRDVSRKLREIVVTSADGASRLWSSNDCYGPPERDVRTMAPNKPLRFTLNWAGRTSAPGCPVERQPVPAGSYQVVGKLGALTGAPAPLTLTP